jgi:hypothetical protein
MMAVAPSIAPGFRRLFEPARKTLENQCAAKGAIKHYKHLAATLARLRAESVVPRTGKIQICVEVLQNDVNAASSTATQQAGRGSGKAQKHTQS